MNIFHSFSFRSLVTELTGVSDTIHQPRCHVYEETEIPVKDVDLRLAKELFSRKPETEFRNISARPVHIAADRDKSGAKKSFKISDFKFRHDGQFLAVRTEGVPSTVFIFRVSELRLDSVLVHRFPVVSSVWGPVPPFSDCLTILTSGIQYFCSPCLFLNLGFLLCCFQICDQFFFLQIFNKIKIWRPYSQNSLKYLLK